MNRTCQIILLTGFLAVMSSFSCTAADNGPHFPYTIQHHDLKIELNLQDHSLSAVDLLTLKRTLPKPVTLDLLLRKGLKVTSVQLEGENLVFRQIEPVDPLRFEASVDSEDVTFYSRAQALSITLPKSAKKRDELQVQIKYEGIIADSLAGADFSREYVAMQITGIIDTAGVYLGPEGIFYPALPGQIFTYSLQVALPESYQSVSEGDFNPLPNKQGQRIEAWVCNHPMDGFHLIAGQYQVNSLDHGKVKISTYFYPAEADLAQGYIDACKGYFDLYEDLLGTYPFSKFAVVDNFFATGYGMPSFTLLGSQVLRLPFIKTSSLGHEVCHNWWGNSVYVDYESGNWCEGLTTYCADYLYKEKKSAADARDYRMGLLRDYLAYTHEGNDFPLKEFRERHNPAQRAVGYGKSAMVFHMLRSQLGDEAFWKSLKRFYQDQVWKFASWDDLNAAFEAESSSKLAWFFDQWVERTGAPHLTLETVKKEQIDRGWKVSFTLNQTQNGNPYLLEIPISIHGADQESSISIKMNQSQQNYEKVVSFAPQSIAVDPNFDLFRRPDKSELAPTLAEVFGSQQLLIVLPNQAPPELQKAYRAMAEQLKSPGDNYRIVREDELAPADLSNNGVLFLGTPMENGAIPAPWLKNDRWKISTSAFTLLGKEYTDEHSSLVTVERNPWNAEQVVGYCCVRQAADLTSLGRKIKHYGKYSYLVFNGNDNAAKGNWEPSESPLIFKF
ncbi:MAG: M1 family aminopeptidase [bacterium]|nr:M1 family aminopeptidase [bacterium]